MDEVAKLMESHLPFRLDGEPPLFRGMTKSELFSTLALGAVVWFPVSIIGAALLGVWPLTFGFFGLALFVTVWIRASRLQRQKRNVPAGHTQHRLQLRLHRWWPAVRLPFIHYAGRWGVGRSVRASR